jgi:hypothetical protein
MTGIDLHKDRGVVIYKKVNVGCKFCRFPKNKGGAFPSCYSPMAKDVTFKSNAWIINCPDDISLCEFYIKEIDEHVEYVKEMVGKLPEEYRYDGWIVIKSNKMWNKIKKIFTKKYKTIPESYDNIDLYISSLFNIMGYSRVEDEHVDYFLLFKKGV